MFKIKDECINASFKLFLTSFKGIGCTFGSGIYVLVGNVIANYAGPSVIFSFVIAGIATFLSGMFYYLQNK